jgi:DNA-binding response OmpR family regulator
MANQPEIPVLLVGKNEPDFRCLIEHLVRSGFAPRAANSTIAAWRGEIEYSPFAIVIDASAPDADWAWNLGREMAEGANSLVLMLVQGNEAAPSLAEWSYGVDRCFPMSAGYCEQVVAYLLRHVERLGDLSRRSGTIVDDQESTLRIDASNQRVYRNGTPISLTRRECALLELLASQPDQALAKEEICSALWQSSKISSRMVLIKQYVGRIRRKIEPDPDHPIHLETVRTIGYCLHPKGRIAKSVD